MTPRRPARAAPVARPLVALLVALVAFVYAPSIQNGFTFDDADVITGAVDLIGHPSRAATLFSPDYFRLSLESTYRPLVTASYMLDWQIGGGRAWVFHVQSVGWHLVSAACLLLLLRRLGAGPAVAWIASAIYGIHPALTEAVDGASFREDVLVTAFVLIGLLIATGNRRHRVLTALGMAACLLAACLAKESGVVFVALLPLTQWAQARASTPRAGVVASAPVRWFRPHVREYALLAACLLAYLAVRLFVYPSPGGYGLRAGDSMFAAAATGLVVIGQYLRLAVLPWPLCADYRGVVQYAGSLPDGRLLAAAAAIGTLTWLAVRWRAREPLMFWGWCWFVVALVPVSNVVPIPQFMAERFLHLPYVGLATFAVAAVAHLSRCRSGNEEPRVLRAPGLAAVAVVILAFAALTWYRHAAWRSNERLWTTTLADYPSSHGGLQGYAAVLIDSGRFGEAMPYLERVLADPSADRDRRASVLVDLAYAQAAVGALEPARRSLLSSIDFSATSRAYQNLAIVTLRLGHPDEAIAEARTAVRLQPDSAEAHAVLGAMLEAGRRTSDAVAEYREASRLKPSLVAAREGLQRLGAR